LFLKNLHETASFVRIAYSVRGTKDCVLHIAFSFEELLDIFTFPFLIFPLLSILVVPIGRDLRTRTPIFFRIRFQFHQFCENIGKLQKNGQHFGIPTYYNDIAEFTIGFCAVMSITEPDFQAKSNASVVLPMVYSLSIALRLGLLIWYGISPIDICVENFKFFLTPRYKENTIAKAIWCLLRAGKKKRNAVLLAELR